MGWIAGGCAIFCLGGEEGPGEKGMRRGEEEVRWSVTDENEVRAQCEYGVEEAGEGHGKGVLRTRSKYRRACVAESRALLFFPTLRQCITE